MAVKIENGFITADTKQELKQGLQDCWAEICEHSAQKTTEEVIRIQQWEMGLEKFNKSLLAVVALLLFIFPLNCLMIMKLNQLANAFITSIGD